MANTGGSTNGLKATAHLSQEGAPLVLVDDGVYERLVPAQEAKAWAKAITRAADKAIRAAENKE